MNISDEQLEAFVRDLDAVIHSYPEFQAHNVAGILLSRVVLLMTMDPETGKGLLKYVWEQLDQIEQANPGGMIE